MDEKLIIKKKKLIDKYLKRKSYVILFDILMENIDESTTYIRLDYDKKSSTYRLSWFNISQMNTNKVESWINSTLMHPSKVDEFKAIIANNGISADYVDEDNINSLITINSYLTNYKYNKNAFQFKRYIPSCWKFLADAIYILFNYMPKYIYPLFQIMVQKIVEPRLSSLFAFDFVNDDYKKLFNEAIIEKGENYYKDKRVVFLENFGNSLYSVVRGESDYLVTIIHNDDINELQLSCTCPCNYFCKHMYAAIKAYKNNEIKKFYKIAYVNDDVLESIKNFNYFLCIGIYQDFFIVVQDDNYSLLPILNDNKLSMKIVEDDDKKSLEKELNKYLKSKHIEEK